MYISKNELDNLLSFYKKLGYNKEQIKKVCRYVFNEELITENQRAVFLDKSLCRGVSLKPDICFLNAHKSISNSVVSLDTIDDCCLLFEEECNDSFSFEGDSEKSSFISAYDLMNREKYQDIAEESFRNVLNSPTSTFSSTVNTASMSIIKEKLFNNFSNYNKITPSMVRIEEMLNYFDYYLSAPKKRVFNINTEISKKPNSNHKYLFVGLKGKEVEIPRQNIVLLVDASGSMHSRGIQVQKAILTLLKQLKPDDRVSLVTYSSKDHLIFEGLCAKDIDIIIDKLRDINITGCTNGSAGLDMAYKLVDKYYIKDGNNRVIMITDGDLNFGVCDNDRLKSLIKDKKETGAFLSLIGVGVGNYQDSIMEVLAKNGNGNYFKISDDFDILEIFQKRINSTLVSIAKDVKIQVEFNPGMVKSYRLLGYENRSLNHEDFSNDAISAEPVGSGHSVVAVYELEMIDSPKKCNTDLKYQKIEVLDSKDICTVSVRYKLPNSEISDELCVTVKDSENTLSNNMKICYSVILLGEYLRKSEYYEKGGIDEAINILSGLDGDKIDMLNQLLKMSNNL